MSKVVDERVVEMRFDNQQFERNVQTSMSTLEKLKNSIKSLGASKGLETISASSSGTASMVNLGHAVENVRVKFSALDVAGVAALANITNSAVNAGKRLAASLSIDQISAGWDKFSKKTTSVATLVAQGNAIADVNSQLNRLNWYTDETSYNFTDMVDNIAKFTASGRGLSESVTAMEGIANWAAVSGQNAQTASRAMYQLSQAMGAGVMRMEDYRSIQNASMDTAEFRQKCLDAAVALKTLKKNADGTYQSLVSASKDGAESFNIDQFASKLTQGAWLTSDVMIKVYNDYANAVNEIYRVTQEKGMLASDVIDEIHNKAESEGISTDKAIKELGYSFDSFSLKAFEAGQKARTFSDAIDSVKDAVSTSWMNTFEIIFGDADQATKLWTDVANNLFDIFASGGEKRNEMLSSVMTSKWDQLVDKMKEAGVSATTFENTIRKTAKDHGIAIDDLIKEYGSLGKVISAGKLSKSVIVESIKKLAGNFGKTTKAVKVTTDSLEHFQKIVNKVIRGDFGNGADRVKALTKAGENYAVVQGLVNKVWARAGYTWKDTAIKAGDLTNVINNLSEKEIQSLGYTKEQSAALKELAKEAEQTGTPINELIENLNKPSGRELVFDTMHNALSGIASVLETVKEAWSEIFSSNKTSGTIYKILEAINKLSKKMIVSDDAADKLKRTFKGLFAAIDIVTTLIGSPLKIALKIFKQLMDALDIDVLDLTARIGDAIVRFDKWLDSTFDLSGVFKALAPYIKKAASLIKEFVGNIKNSKPIQKFSEHMKTLSTQTKDFISSLKNTKFIQNLISMFKTLTDRTKEWFTSIKDTQFIKDLMSQMKHLSESFKEWVRGLKETENVPKYLFEGFVKGFQNGIKKITEWARKIGETILKTICEVLGIHSPSTEGIKIGANFIDGIIIGIKNTLGALWDIVSTVGQGIISGAKKVEWNKIVAVAFGAGLLVSMRDTLKVLKNMTAPIMTFSDLLNSVNSVISGVGKALSKAIKRMSRAASLRTISRSVVDFAKAIAILAASLYLVSKIESSKLKSSIEAIGAMAGIVAILATAVALLNRVSLKDAAKNGGKGSDIQVTVKTVLALCAGVLLIAIAIKKVSSIGDTGTMFAAAGSISLVLGIAGIMLVLFASIGKKRGVKNVDKIGNVFLKIGATLIILAKVMKTIGNMDSSSYQQAMEAIVGFEILAAILIGISKKSGSVDKAGAGILAIAGAFVLMAYAVEMLGEMNVSTLKQGGVAVAIMAALILAMIFVIKLIDPADSNGALKAGGAVLAIAGAMVLMANAVKVLGEMNVDELEQGKWALVELASLIVALMGVAALLSGVEGDGALKAGGGILAISIAIGIMAMTLKMIGSMKTAEIEKGRTTILLFGAMIAGLIYVTKYAGDNALKAGGSMLSIAVAIGVLAAIVYIIGQMEPDAIKKGLIVVGALTAFMVGLMAATKLAKSCVGTVIALTVAIAVLAGAVIALSFIEPNKLAGAVAAIAILLAIFAGLMYVSKYATKSFGTIIVLTVMVAVLAAALYALASLPIENAMVATVGLSLVLLSIAAVCAIMSAIPISAALSAVGSLGIFIGGMLLILAALGGLSKIPGFNELISDGGDTLALVGEAIGKFVGSILKAAIEQIAASLPAIGKGLSGFAAGASFFIMMMQTVGPDVVKGAGYLAAAIIALSAAEFISGVMSLFSGRFSLALFGLELSKFMEGAGPFIDGIKSVDMASAIGAKALSEAILALTKAELLNGITSFFAGKSSIAKFGEQIGYYIDALISASNKLKGTKINKEAMIEAAVAGEALSRLANSLPKEGGLWQKIVGTHIDLDAFGKAVGAFIDAIIQTSNKLNNVVINTDGFQSAKEAGDKMCELAKSIPKTGGLLQDLVGEQDISLFGLKVVAFVAAIIATSNALSNVTIDPKAFENAATAGEKMLELQEVLPKTGGLWQKVAGTKDIADYGTKIATFGESIATFATKLAGIESFNKINTAVQIAQTMADVSDKVQNIDLESLSQFGDKIEDFGENISKFSETAKDLDIPAINLAASGVQALINMANAMVGKDYSSIASLATSLQSLGKVSVSKFAKSVKEAAGQASSAGSTLVSNVIKGANSKAPSLTNTAKKIASNMAGSFKGKNKDFKSAGTTLMDGLKDGLKNGSSPAKKAISSTLSSAVSNIRNYRSSFYDAGEYCAKGFASGINDNAYRGKIAAVAMAQAAYDAAKEKLKINSPSKIFRALSASVPEGFAQGIIRNLGSVRDSATSMADAAIDSTKSAISRIADIMQMDMDAQPTIRPVVDLSNVEAGARSVGELFNIDPSMNMLNNIGTITTMMSRRQNGSNDVVNAIKDLSNKIDNRPGDTYNFGDFTYSDGSEVSEAIQTLVRAARIERRN